MTLISTIINDPMISNESEQQFPQREMGLQFNHALQKDIQLPMDQDSIYAVFQSTQPKCSGCGNNLTGTECLDCAKQTSL